MIIAFGIFCVLFLLAVVGTSASYFRNKEARTVNRKYVNVVDDTFRSIQMTLSTIEKSVGQTNEMMSSLMIDMRHSVPWEGALRCYAVFLQKGVETRLFIQPARTLEEMIEIVTQQFGMGWSIMASAHVDVGTMLPAAPTEVKIEKRIEKKAAPSVGKYVMDLEYARDKFAETKSEKAAIEKVITNIKKHYGRSTSAS